MSRFVFLTVMLFALCPMAVSAQSISRMLRTSGLSPEDFDIMAKAADTLYVKQAPVQGANTAWENPATKSYGTVSLDSVSGDCVGILHRVHPKGAAEGREIRNRRCKSSDGKWVNAVD